jgi:1-pyrroline-4-hydroxy-2-carboxylate deaminase
VPTEPQTQPWHGVLVANALPYTDDLEVDFDRYAEHVAWLAASGCDGITPNGSLGEYQVLTPEERARVVETAVAAAPPGFSVIPGVAAYGARESARLAEHAAKAGAPAVMLARLFDEGLIVGVKEFTGDPRRAYAISELAPGLDVLIGSDDSVVEFAIAGARGWVSGYTNAFPRTCVELYRASMAKDLETAVPLYRLLHPLLRWDARTEFVQAIKLSMEMAGRYGGPCRPPRQPLTAEQEAEVRAATEKAMARGCA